MTLPCSNICCCSSAAKVDHAELGHLACSVTHLVIVVYTQLSLIIATPALDSALGCHRTGVVAAHFDRGHAGGEA